LIDTHAHLLPGIDDGATSLEETLRLADAAVEAGIDEIVCTPHLGQDERWSPDRAPKALGEVENALAGVGSPLSLHLGYEVAFSFAARLGPEELRELTFARSGKVLLVELPRLGWPPSVEGVVFRWRVQGILPVIAHPERCERVQRDPAVLERLLRLGAVAQGTVPSLLGFFGSRSRRCLLRLLANGHVSLLASDAHSVEWGYAAFTRALGDLRRLSPGLNLETLTVDNPRRALDGRPLLDVAPAGVGVWRRLRLSRR
jgi:protein-tyrosine phosphatase